VLLAFEAATQPQMLIALVRLPPDPHRPSDGFFYGWADAWEMTSMNAKGVMQEVQLTMVAAALWIDP